MPASRKTAKMPASRKVAQFNKRFLNRLFLRVAGRLPGFGIVGHVGRRSGRAYRTPVNVFRTDDGYLIALTYGSEADWVKNVLAAGSCELLTRGRRVSLSNPCIETDEAKSWAPLPVRFILNRIDAPEYMLLSAQRAGFGRGVGVRGRVPPPAPRARRAIPGLRGLRGSGSAPCCSRPPGAASEQEHRGGGAYPRPRRREEGR
jgi:deazaflavin-dependent oxidoreductase (nitroreductase family)